MLTACSNRELDLFTATDSGLADAGTDAGTTFIADAIATGDSHACAIHSGALWCWGSNASGQLGLGDTLPRNRPTPLDAGTNWVEVTAGYEATCARKTDGSVWCWGDNSNLTLGQGGGGARSTPGQVPLMFAASQVALHFAHACAISAADQSLHCWGFNTEGQLGLNDGFPGQNQGNPQPVSGGMQWKQVSAGQGHTCAIRSDGTMWCWGRNSDGEGGLGNGAPIQTRSPQQVGTDNTWLEVRATQNASCALKQDHSLWCFGEPYDGTTNNLLAPTRIGTRNDLQHVEMETFNVCTLDSTGKQQCWGRNDEGELGNGDTASIWTPTDVAGGPWLGEAVGRFFRCNIDQAGHVFCTGENSDGELGVGDNMRRNVLSPVAQ
ncbi:MAG: hypothetical protein QM723_15220 [Myxococcaceae bacterium]